MGIYPASQTSTRLVIEYLLLREPLTYLRNIHPSSVY